MLAVGRLVLDNFRHIKAFWINVGLKLAQVSLAFGVDDLDGTVVEEKISHAAGVDTGQAIEREELVRVIRAAGRVPVERDTLYNVVRRYDEPPGGRGGAAPRPRVGRIEFVNCFPLYLHFEEELAARGVQADVVAGSPTELNRMLVDGSIDMALPSSIEFARNHACLLCSRTRDRFVRGGRFGPALRQVPARADDQGRAHARRAPPRSACSRSCAASGAWNRRSCRGAGRWPTRWPTATACSSSATRPCYILRAGVFR